MVRLSGHGRVDRWITGPVEFRSCILRGQRAVFPCRHIPGRLKGVFYVRAAQAAHEMACQEAVARYDTGVTITNLAELERKKVDGKVVITRKGSHERIRGADVKLSTDVQKPQSPPHFSTGRCGHDPGRNGPRRQLIVDGKAVPRCGYISTIQNPTQVTK